MEQTAPVLDGWRSLRTLFSWSNGKTTAFQAVDAGSTPAGNSEAPYQNLAYGPGSNPGVCGFDSRRSYEVAGAHPAVL